MDENKNNVVPDEYEEIFKWLKENNDKAKKEDKKVREDQYKLAQEKRRVFKNRVICLISAALLAPVLVTGAKASIDKMERQQELNIANNYMNIQMNYVCPQLERGVLSDNSVVLFDNSIEDIQKIYKELMEKYGFTSDCAVYIISQKYGDEGFDKIVSTMGFKDSDEYLYKRYFQNYSQKRVYSRNWSYRAFENKIQIELVSKVNELKNIMDERQLTGKGVNL